MATTIVSNPRTEREPNKKKIKEITEKLRNKIRRKQRNKEKKGGSNYYMSCVRRLQSSKTSLPPLQQIVRVLGGDTKCPLQVFQLSRSSESTHFISLLRRDVALLGSTRAPDGFRERRHVPPVQFLTIPNRNANFMVQKPDKFISIQIIPGLSRPHLITSPP